MTAPPCSADLAAAAAGHALAAAAAGRAERAERAELGRRGRGDDLRIRRERQVPAGALLGGRGGHARVEPGHGELEGLRVGLEDAEVGDDLLRPGAVESEPLA